MDTIDRDALNTTIGILISLFPEKALKVNIGNVSMAGVIKAATKNMNDEKASTFRKVAVLGELTLLAMAFNLINVEDLGILYAQFPFDIEDTIH